MRTRPYFDPDIWDWRIRASMLFFELTRAWHGWARKKTVLHLFHEQELYLILTTRTTCCTGERLWEGPSVDVKFRGYGFGNSCMHACTCNVKKGEKDKKSCKSCWLLLMTLYPWTMSSLSPTNALWRRMTAEVLTVTINLVESKEMSEG